MTHINAYEQDVLEAEQRLAYAEAQLSEAKERLKAKKAEDKVEEPEKVEVRVKGEKDAKKR